jgi:hypothetical protein
MKRDWSVPALFIIPFFLAIVTAFIPKTWYVLEFSLLAVGIILMLISVHYAKESV